MNNNGNTWTSAQTREQFSAIAWLRWRIFINAFRRKGGTGELVGRILLIPVLSAFAILPSIGVAFGAFYFTQGDRLGTISWLLWATFVYCQFLNIQLGQSGTAFDPTELIRFPLAARNYIYIRLCFGLLTPANVIGSMMAACIALGVIIAQPSLWLVAILALSVFSLANVLFSRMLFAWVDRWMATRRAREIYTGIFFAVMLLGQWANFTFNPAYNHGHHTSSISPAHMQMAMHFVHSAEPYMVWLPPELTANALAVAARNHLPQAAEMVLVCALYAVVFFIVFALRMRTEFRGENISDNANAVSKKALKPGAARAPAAMLATSQRERTFGLSTVVVAQLGKELLYLRRNVGVLYGVIAPVVLVLIFASRFASRGGASAWVFPGAVAYTMLTISTFSYNSFGLEGTGSQFYFLAPVRMRDVILAKNIMNFLLAIAEVGLTFAAISWFAGMPPLSLALSAVLWAVGTMLISTIAGNMRSFTTPKKITSARAMGNKQVSQLSALIGMGILMASAAVAAVPIGLAFYLDKTWIMLPFFLVFALVALFFYERSLRGIDRFALNHRDELFEELCKAA